MMMMKDFNNDEDDEQRASGSHRYVETAKSNTNLLQKNSSDNNSILPAGILSNSTTTTTLASNQTNQSASNNNRFDKTPIIGRANDVSYIDDDDDNFDGDINVSSRGAGDSADKFEIKYSSDREISNNSLRRKLNSLLRVENLIIDTNNNNQQQQVSNMKLLNGKSKSMVIKSPGNQLDGQSIGNGGGFEWSPSRAADGVSTTLNCIETGGANGFSNVSDIQGLEFMKKQGRESNLVVGLKLLAIFSTIYFFMWSSSILSQAFNLTSYHYAGHFIRTSGFLQNPLIGLMVGVITTVIFQSSGAVTSVLVTIVGSGVLNVRQSIPIIMGANLGTSVTNTVVSLIVYKKKENFEIAMTAGIVHDMYNMMSVVFMLPIELLIHPLEYSSDWMLKLFSSSDTQSTSSTASSIINDKLQFLSYLVKPLVDLVIVIDKDATNQLDPNYIVPSNVSLVKKCCNSIRQGNETICLERCFSLFSHLDLSDNIVCFLLIIIAMITLFTCLIFVVKVTKSLLGGKMLNWVAKLARKEYKHPWKLFVGYLFILVGVIITIILHSSGVFTSMLVPLAGGDVLSLIQIYELTLGSNIGTTATGILAALSAQSKYPMETLQVALCHFIFNVAGILMFYSIPHTMLPIWASKRFGMLSAKNMWFSIGYLVIVFLVAPTVTMLIYFATTH